MKSRLRITIRKKFIPAFFRYVLLFLLFLILPFSYVFAEVTEQDILDAISGIRTFTNEELLYMDLNEDGEVDVADIVYFQKPVASFASAESEIDETGGTHNIMLTFSKPVTCTLNYTVGGTASSTDPPNIDDFTHLSGSVAVNESSAAIQVLVISDTVYEGNETIVLNLLPGEAYLLSAERTHTITLNDNPFESSADYLFILSIETQGVEGKGRKGSKSF